MVKTQSISYSIGSKKILDDISTEFLPGKLNMILGPNGSGKSTFLKIFSGTLPGYNGSIYYDQLKISPKNIAELAAYRAVLGQQPDLSFPMLVDEVVMMGRYPHFKTNPSSTDFAICDEVIDRMKLKDFTHRNYLTLSGGEKQRVQFARVLAQIWHKAAAGKHRYLFLDEPLNNLDINYQFEFLQIAKSFCASDTVVIAIVHDINLSIQFADEVYFMKAGKLVKRGHPSVVITEKLVEDVFDIRMKMIGNPAYLMFGNSSDL